MRAFLRDEGETPPLRRYRRCRARDDVLCLMRIRCRRASFGDLIVLRPKESRDAAREGFSPMADDAR